MAEDPFGWMVPLCRISSSQEERLRHRPFALAPLPEHLSAEETSPDSGEETSPGSGEIPVENAAIVMVSLSDSASEDAAAAAENDEEFQTPSEGSGLSGSHDREPPMTDVWGAGRVGGATATNSRAAEEEEALDLVRDSESEYSDVELAQREKPYRCVVFSRRESNRFGASERTLFAGEGFGESQQPKILKISANDLGSETARDRLGATDENRDFLCHTRIKSQFEGAMEDIVDEEADGDYGEQRNVHVTDELGKFSEEEHLGSLWDLLRLLAERRRESGQDPAPKMVNIVETAKRRGMTFPRPKWWPEKGFPSRG